MVSGLLPLRLQGVAVRRRGRTILGPLDLTLQAEGLTILMGPNGSGKTTLLRVLHGIERVSAGTVAWAAVDEAAQRRQAYVFQQPIMLRRSVADNLRYPLHIVATPRAEADAAVAFWLDQIGLAPLAETPATRLSGGERQKLALARALIRKPEVLFLDEPCANLDGRSTREIEALLLDTAARGTRLIMATHDMGQARRLATEAIFLLSGRLHESGAAPQFFASPQTPELAAFLRGDIVE